MSLPITGWLTNNPDTEEVLPAKLPVFFTGQYKVGTDSFVSISDPRPSSTNVKFGDCVVTFDHGLNEDGTEYGLSVNIIRKGAFGSIVVDTLTIPEVALNQLIVEVCPEPFDKVVEVCPDNMVEIIEANLRELDDTIEPVLPATFLENYELPCGVIEPFLFNGLRLFDGSWQIL